MAMTPSSMVQLGTKAPDFSLVDTVSGKILSLDELKGAKATVIMFICNHCPYVIHLREAIVAVANQFSDKGVSFVAISSNDAVAYPEDSPAKMKEIATSYHFLFPYLFDETQAVAKAYDAACTPDFFVYNGKMLLKYRGQFDDSRPSNQVTPSGKDLAAAIDAICSGNEPDKLQKPSIGCNIKWRKA